MISKYSKSETTLKTRIQFLDPWGREDMKQMPHLLDQEAPPSFKTTSVIEIFQASLITNCNHFMCQQFNTILLLSKTDIKPKVTAP